MADNQESKVPGELSRNESANKPRRIDLSRLEKARKQEKPTREKPMWKSPSAPRGPSGESARSTPEPAKTASEVSRKTPSPSSNDSPQGINTLKLTWDDLSVVQEAAQVKKKLSHMELDIRFLSRFSFASACGIYLLNAGMWPFLILPLLTVALTVFSGSPWWYWLATLLFLLIYPLSSVFFFFTLAYTQYDSPWLVEGGLEMVAGPEGIIALAFAIILLINFISAGLTARRRRWAYLNWANFAEFKAVELRWQFLGISLWWLFALVAIGAFFLRNYPEIYDVILGIDFLL